MYINKNIFLKVISIFCCTIVCSQLSIYAQENVESLIPHRPKMIEFSMETLLDYHTNSSSNLYGEAKNEIERDQLLKMKIGLPLLIQENRMLGVQFKYYQQRFFLDTDDFSLDYDLYHHLDNKKFTNTGLRFLYKESLSENKEVTIIGGAEMMSDKKQWNRLSTRYFLSTSWKHAVSNRLTMGVGFAANYTILRPSIYPIFYYERKLQRNWTLDLVLPKSVEIRKQFNNANFFLAKASFRGWRYNLTNSVEGANKNLTLRKADLQFTISWEREIHDWLWMGFDIGYNKNLNYSLTESGASRRDALIDLRSNDAKYVKVSLFIVPPKSIYNCSKKH